MQTIAEKKELNEATVQSKILEEKEMLFSKPKRKKFFDSRRLKKMKEKIANTFIIVIFITLISYFILMCISVDFCEDKIYDEYNEFDDKEFAYIVKDNMKDLTISKNVNVNFIIMYKDVFLESFLSDKINTSEENVTIIYNPIEETLNMTSNIDYLIGDYKWENIEDVKKEIPKYFSMIEKSIEKNVYIADFHTITFDHIKSKENGCLALFFLIILLGVLTVLIKLN